MAAQKNCYVHHTQLSSLQLMNKGLSTQGSSCQASGLMFNPDVEQGPWLAVFAAVINGLPLFPHNLGSSTSRLLPYADKLETGDTKGAN